MLFSAYRRDEFADPEGFLVQLGVVLEGYEDEVILAVTSPRTGIQRRLKFPPSIAEVTEACEAEAAAKATRERYAKIPRLRRIEWAPQYAPGRRANVHVHRDASVYQSMLARTQAPDADVADWRIDANGELFVSIGWFDHVGIGRWTRPQPPKEEAALRHRETAPQQ